MVHELDGLRASLRSHRGLPRLDIGVGINTGPMVVGNMGSRERLAYTVIGDAVNVASRLQNLNKQFGTHVLTTESTRKVAGDRFLYRAIDQVKLRGHGRSRSQSMSCWGRICLSHERNRVRVLRDSNLVRKLQVRGF